MQTLSLTPDVARKIIPAHPSHLTSEELGAVLEASDLLDSYIALARTEATRRINAGEPIQGWELVSTRGKRSIPDPVLAARQLAPLLEPHQILDCATLSLGKVESAIKEAEGCSEKEAREIMADYLKGNIVKGAGGEKLQQAPKQAVELHPIKQAVLAPFAPKPEVGHE
jgi:hypothetical protein